MTTDGCRDDESFQVSVEDVESLAGAGDAGATILVEDLGRILGARGGAAVKERVSAFVRCVAAGDMGLSAREQLALALADVLVDSATRAASTFPPDVKVSEEAGSGRSDGPDHFFYLRDDVRKTVVPVLRR